MLIALTSLNSFWYDDLIEKQIQNLRSLISNLFDCSIQSKASCYFLNNNAFSQTLKLSGQISAQRAALRVREFRSKHSESVAGYLEEMIIRRELSDNFCFYNSDKYDSLKGGYEWAQKTLNDHRDDKREKVYTKEQLEKAKTYDKLWNAAQVC